VKVGAKLLRGDVKLVQWKWHADLLENLRVLRKPGCVMPVFLLGQIRKLQQARQA